MFEDECAHCKASNGAQVSCLICGAHSHVTCAPKAKFSLNLIPLQEYVTWDNLQLTRWLKDERKLKEISTVIRRFGVDGIGLGELTTREMTGILKLTENQCGDLKKAIKYAQVWS